MFMNLVNVALCFNFGIRTAVFKSVLIGCRLAIKGLEIKVTEYHKEYSKYPTNMSILYENKMIKKGQLKDPWNIDWDYKLNSNNDFYLRSYGPDKKPNTIDDINAEHHPFPKQ